MEAGGYAAEFLIELWSDSLSSNDIWHKQSNILVYPNPTKDYFTVMNFPNDGTIKNIQPVRKPCVQSNSD